MLAKKGDTFPGWVGVRALGGRHRKQERSQRGQKSGKLEVKGTGIVFQGTTFKNNSKLRFKKKKKRWFSFKKKKKRWT